MSGDLKRVLAMIAAVVFVIVAGLMMKKAADRLEDARYPLKYAETIEAKAEENGLPASLVYAVVKTESGFEPDAESSVGARGLMQLTKETFEWIDYRRGETGAVWDDMYDPETNLDYGTFLLSQLMEEFGTVENALAAYHAGWNAVKNWLADSSYSSDGKTLDKIPYPDTEYYVDKVTKTMEGYQETYDMD